MQFGISGKPIPPALRYASAINKACGDTFFPLVAYAIACNESIVGEIAGKWNACTVCSADGGHGLFQLTSSWPAAWDDPDANARYAVQHFLYPALLQWRVNAPNVLGDDLVRAIAATFNAGFGLAWDGHKRGDVDLYTTDRYGQRALSYYRSLESSGTI